MCDNKFDDPDFVSSNPGILVFRKFFSVLFLNNTLNRVDGMEE